MASPNAVAAPARLLRAVSPRATRRWRRDAPLVVTLGQPVRAADVALSMAKRAGRDRVVATSGT